jgi:hypothetical protein
MRLQSQDMGYLPICRKTVRPVDNPMMFNDEKSVGASQHSQYGQPANLFAVNPLGNGLRDDRVTRAVKCFRQFLKLFRQRKRNMRREHSRFHGSNLRNCHSTR